MDKICPPPPRPLVAIFFDESRRQACGLVACGGPGVSLTLCCFVVYSTRRFVVCLSVCHFALVFFSPFSIAITSLGEKES